MPSILLVQGPASAMFLRQRIDSVSVKKCICYDARSQALMEDFKFSVTNSAHYFEGEHERLLEWDAVAQHLSRHWFEEIPAFENPGGVRAESFFIRTLNLTFIAILRAFYLLEKINQKEGGVPLITTRLSKTGREPIEVRWQPEESPIPLLLEEFKDRWKFKTEFYDLPPQARPETFALASFINEGASTASLPWKKSKILFSGNPSLLEPVRKELSKRGLNSSRIRIGTRMRDSLGAFHSEEFLLPVPSYPAPARLVDEPKILAALREKKVFVIDGVDLLPIFWHKLQPLLHRQLPRFSFFYQRVRSIFEKVEPEMVIVDEDVTEFQKAIICAAKNLGIRTLVVIHGLPGTAFGFVPLEADAIAVWGEFSRKILQGWGVEERRIFVTGCPKYDALSKAAQEDHDSKKNLCRKFGWDEAKPLVLILPGALRSNVLEILEEEERSASPSELLRTAKYFSEIAQRLPGIHFIFKFRLVNPLDFDLFHKMNGLAAGPNIQWIEKGLALDFIQASDLVFNHFSSAGLEAALLRKPVVQMNFSGLPDAYPFAQEGLGASVRNFEQALDLCKRLEERKLPLEKWIGSQEQLIEPFLFSRDGKSAERVAELIANWKSSEVMQAVE